MVAGTGDTEGNGVNDGGGDSEGVGLVSVDGRLDTKSQLPQSVPYMHEPSELISKP